MEHWPRRAERDHMGRRLQPQPTWPIELDWNCHWRSSSLHHGRSRGASGHSSVEEREDSPSMFRFKWSWSAGNHHRRGSELSDPRTPLRAQRQPVGSSPVASADCNSTWSPNHGLTWSIRRGHSQPVRAPRASRKPGWVRTDLVDPSSQKSSDFAEMGLWASTACRLFDEVWW